MCKVIIMTFGTIVRTFVFALFGAAFGYILGRIFELFPALNQALLDGLHAITGRSAVTMPGLLAAIGLLAGIALGLLISFTLTGMRHSAYVRPLRREMRRAKRYFKYAPIYSTRDCGGCGCEDGFGNAPRSVDETLEELDGYVSYLEDLPKDRLTDNKEDIVHISERLTSLGASLDR